MSTKDAEPPAAGSVLDGCGRARTATPFLSCALAPHLGALSAKFLRYRFRKCLHV
jgi:hypothetical protein